MTLLRANPLEQNPSTDHWVNLCIGYSVHADHRVGPIPGELHDVHQVKGFMKSDMAGATRLLWTSLEDQFGCDWVLTFVNIFCSHW